MNAPESGRARLAPLRAPRAAVLALILALAVPSARAAMPAAPGVTTPEEILHECARDPDTVRLERAWIHKMARWRTERAEAEAAGLRSVNPNQATLSVPILAGKYSNTGADPFAPSALQTHLFVTNPNGTVSTWYQQVSNGAISVTGMVYGSQGQDALIPAPNVDTYYEGTSNGRVVSTSRTGDYLKALLDSTDAWVDFGQYDNDGPDGVPNSGDDDGFVDLCAFVQPESDGAYGGGNIWSHQWRYTMWHGAAYTTNDPAAAGGSIRVDDYSIQPLVALGGAALSPIGVYVHEFLHAFGLPDLYDVSGSSYGIGLFGVMSYGAYGGNWSTPQTPVEPCAWTKEQLGWATVTDLASDRTAYTINAADTSNEVVRIHPVGVGTDTVSPYQYFLIENRVRRGWDALLPTGGVAIFHVNNNSTWTPVMLEQADGLYQLDNRIGLFPGDAGDLFPGTTGATAFGDSTTPSNSLYWPALGQISEFDVTNLQILPGPSQARFDLDVAWTLQDVTPPALAINHGGLEVACVDWDGDDDPDLYFADNFLGNRLLRNDLGAGFVDVTPTALQDFATDGMAWADYDDDGDPDVYLARASQANRLLRNDGGGTFTDVTAGPLGDAGAGGAVGWADHDLDGDLDLYLANPGTANKLFRNDGGDTFTDVTSGPLGDTGSGRTVRWIDYDLDDDPDLYVGNVVGANKLLRNDGGGAFTDVTTGALGDVGNCEGLLWEDFDQDGDPDLYFINNGAPQHTNKLLRNDGAAGFTDVTPAALAVALPMNAVTAADWDLDGDLDLYAALSGPQFQVGDCRLFRNDGGLSFSDATAGAEAAGWIANGCATADFDRDGRPDVVTAGNQYSRLLRSGAGANDHWIKVDLVGVVSNRDGVGARVRAVAGGVSRTRFVHAEGDGKSQAERTLHFGLGASTTVDTLEVTWPGGRVQITTAVAADARYTITEAVTFADATVSPVDDAGFGYGMAWGDFDGDQDPDLYVANYNQPNKLFRNDGGGSFADVTSGPLGHAGSSNCAAWGDHDNDGDPDLYLGVTAAGNVLLRNDGAAGFTDVSSGVLASARSTSGVAWSDTDGDGDLDLFLCNTGQANQLMRNDGGGSFADVSSGPLADTGFGLGCAFADYDLDGDPDLYFSNYAIGTNRLLRNDGGNTFADVTAGPLGDTGHGQGVAWGDHDNDGDFDLYLANDGDANKLFRNDGASGFADVTSGPLGDTGAGAGVTWLDYDNDTDLDLYVARTGQTNLLLRNDGGGVFTDVSGGPEADPGNGIGTAAADWDGDGDQDLYVVNQFAANRLLENFTGAASGGWIVVNLTGGSGSPGFAGGTSSNLSAIGARVRLVSNGVTQVRQVSGGAGYGSQDSAALHFGTCAHAIVDTLQITWPGSGAVETMTAVPVNRTYFFEQGVEPVSSPVVSGPSPAWRFLPPAPNPFRHRTALRFSLPRSGPVRLALFDTTGRRVRTLLDGVRAAGPHEVIWDGRDREGRSTASGVYWIRLESGTRAETRKVTRLR